MITENALQSAALFASHLGALSRADVRSALQPGLSESQIRDAEALVDQAADILEKLTQATVPKFNGRGSLTLRWVRDEGFNAGAIKFGEGHDYVISISVDAPIVLLAIAHEIWAPSGRAPSRSGLIEQDILSKHMQPGEITPMASTTALDATYLLYFHELAHVLWNHCLLDWKATPANDRRALELQADYHAAFTFVYWKAWRTGSTASTDWRAIAADLVSAALLLSTALKGFSAPSDAYHFPTTRLLAFMKGAFRSIDGECNGRIELSPFPDQNAEGEFIGPLIHAFLERLLATDLRRLAGTESEIARDLEQFHTVTVPREEELSASMESLWASLDSGPSSGG